MLHHDDIISRGLGGLRAMERGVPWCIDSTVRREVVSDTIQIETQITHTTSAKMLWSLGIKNNIDGGNIEMLL